MNKRLIGIDVLRGLGIFFVVALHSAFYYFGGLFELDMDNPPLIVTIIGLLLMFAGMFAMINGLVHFFNFEGRIQNSISPKNALTHQIVAGFFILVVAYVYFLFTGPGLAIFATKSFDNSFLVELIRNGNVIGISMDRILYIDSLVMLGTNTILCGLIAFAVNRLIKNKKRLAPVYFFTGMAFALISIVRIPLYKIYIDALDNKNMAVVLLLNWLVNKNNPILPFLAFGILGMWLASFIRYNDITKIRSGVIPAAGTLFVIGVTMYIMLPDTMLQRSIDMKWFSIMVAQIGLFLMMITGFVYYFDVYKKSGKLSILMKFINRFGVAGFTVFFLESIVSACVYRIIKMIYPQVSFTIAEALIYGFCLAVFWGLLLILWEKAHYKYGLEYWYGVCARRFGGSTKGDRLRGE